MTSAEVLLSGPVCFEQHGGIAYVRIRRPRPSGASRLPTWGEMCGALVQRDANPDLQPQPRPQGTLKCRFA